MTDQYRAGAPKRRPLTSLETPDIRNPPKRRGWPLWVWLTAGAATLFMVVALSRCCVLGILPAIGMTMWQNGVGQPKQKAVKERILLPRIQDAFKDKPG